MGLTKKEITEFRDELADAHNPLFFYDDDPDGMCSFLLFYRQIKEGHGIILKTHPKLDDNFLRKVDEYQPDKIFVLDIPNITEEFIQGCKRKIVWLDHHQPNPKPGTKYFNPMNEKKDNRPTCYWAYKIVEQDMWISMLGCIGDWFLPEFSDEFIEEYPDLMRKGITNPGEALFETRIGELSRIFAFIAKGPTKKVHTCMKILTRIRDPYEILDGTTSNGRFILKVFERINEMYQDIRKDVKTDDSKLIQFVYSGNRMAFTSDLSNDLLYHYPEKFIIVGREKNGEVKMSLRSAKIPVLPIIEKALQGVDGYGGGHRFACGSCVKVKDFEKFTDNIRRQLSLTSPK